MIEKTRDNGIVVHLAEIKEARKVLDVLELTDITFQGCDVIIEGRLKAK